MKKHKEEPRKEKLTPDQKELVAHIKLELIRAILKLDDYRFFELMEKAYKEGKDGANKDKGIH